MFSVFSGLYIVPLYTLMQERSSPELRARVVAGNNILNALFIVVSAVLLMFLFAQGYSIPEVFLICAGLNAIVAAYIYSLLPEFTLRFFAWILANLLYRVRVFGREHFPDDGPAVLVCNHVTFIDWLIIASATQRPIRFVMDHAYFKNPVLKRFCKQGKVIPIASARVNAEMMNQAFKSVALALSEGDLVCIFPEGKLTRDGKMNSFRPGIERIIRESPVPVIPMALSGFWGSIFSYSERPFLRLPMSLWRRVDLRVGKAIPPEQVGAEKLQALVENLHQLS